ncbi:hypothetical protein L6452_21538 [Arctium lappa]|uniref:Uncharacterized protein n=1 Tax=Arctium lappa TaxID=4217 RepID=A0ACB9AYM0_ARCLA|nr:hypothetical protein L6452_21538 [Arctium lappa]
MAFTRQTFAFIFIFVHIIFAPSSAAKARLAVVRARSASSVVKASSTPSPAAEAGKAGTEDEGFPLPESNDGKKFGSVAEVVTFVTKHMLNIETKVTEFEASLKKRKEHPESSPGIKECFAECDEVMVAAVDDITNTLESLQSQDLIKANFDVTAVMTNVGTCEDCFDEMVGGDPEIKKLDKWVQKVGGEALDALQSQGPPG